MFKKEKKTKKAQEWLSNKYPERERQKVTEISEKLLHVGSLISSKKIVLEGSLKIEKFASLEKFSLQEQHELIDLEINNCPELTEIDLRFFVSPLNSLRISNCLKLTNVNFHPYDHYSTAREVNLLINNCPELTELGCSNKNLSKLELSGNNQLVWLNCSSNKLTELELSNCSNITFLDCSNNALRDLKLNWPKIIKLDCSLNKLASLELSDYSSLEEIDLSYNNLGELTSEGIELDIDEFSQSSVTVYYHNNPFTQGKNIGFGEDLGKKKVRNLLIVGRTGSGKSTLANVMSGTDEFKESEGSISKTKDFQKKEFRWEETKYRVVDTVGVGDTKLGEREVLYKIAEAVYSMPEGISQVLFIVNKRFTQEEIEAFESFREVIFESGIVKYITIVRTNFNNFKNQEECENDKEELCKESKTIAKIIDSCNGVIYVDNPTLDYGDVAKANRKGSREMLLIHLESVCQEYYKLKSWDKLRFKIANYIKEKLELEKNLRSNNSRLPRIESIRNSVAEEVEFSCNVEVSPLLVKLNLGLKAEKLPCCSIL